MTDRGLITAFYPLYITNVLMGYAPFKLSKNKMNGMGPGKIYDGFSLTIVIILVMIYMIYRHHRMVNHPDIDDSALMKFINIMYFSVVLGFTLISYIWSAIQRNHSLKLWNKIIKIDNDIKTMGIQLNYSCISWRTVRFLLCSLISLHTYIFYLLFSQEFHDTLQAGISYGLLYFGVLNHTAVICSFVTLMGFVTHILDIVISKIKSILINPDLHCDSHLRKIMCVYDTLYGILKLINRTFSAQLLLSFGISFVLLTFQTYNVICSVYNQSPYLKYAFAGIILVVVGVFEKFVIVLTCHKCMHQTTVLKLVLNKYMAVHSANRRIHKELNAFALQLLHETFEIHAGSMFLIDLPIFTSVCGTATTYIILLWQTDTGVDLNYSMKKVFGVF